MALKSVLVLGTDGLPQQLQSGDTISAPVNTPSIRAVTNGEASAALVIGTPVYASSADTVKRAQANAKTTSKLAGLWYDTSTASAAVGNLASSGVLVATTAQWDAVAGTTGGLAFNTIYFLDPTNIGKLTANPPSTAGQCNVVVGTAISPTELDVSITQPILL